MIPIANKSKRLRETFFPIKCSDSFARSSFEHTRREAVDNDLLDRASAIQAVADIHCALTTRDRLSSLSYLEQSLSASVKANGDNSSYIINLIEAGIVNALFLHINSLLQRQGSTLQEYQLICHCLDAVLRGSTAMHEDAWKAIRKEGVEILALMTEVLERIKYYDESSPNACCMPSVQRSVMSLAHSLSVGSEGSSLIAQSEPLLHQVVDVLRGRNGNFEPEALHEALGMIKNLTFFEEDDRRYIMRVDGLLTALTSLPLHLIHSMHELDDKKVSEKRRIAFKSALLRLSAVFRNLSMSPECRSELLIFPDFLPTMVKLVTLSEDEHTFAKQQQAVWKNVLNTFINLAMHNQESTLGLLLYDDGILLRLLKKILKSCVSNNPHSSIQSVSLIRQRAIRVVRLLINETTASIILHDHEIVMLISEMALHDEFVEVRSEAVEAFAKFAGTVISSADSAIKSKSPQPYNEVMLDALTALMISQSNQISHQEATHHSLSTAALAQAFKNQAAHASNRIPMMKRELLITKASEIALLPMNHFQTFIENAVAIEDTCCALMYLSLEHHNLAKMCRIPIILSALVKNAMPETGSQYNIEGNAEIRSDHFSISKQFAVKALINLASEDANLSIMAHHPALIQCLIKHARNDLSGFQDFEHRHESAKDEIKDIILKLVNYL